MERAHWLMMAFFFATIAVEFSWDAIHAHCAERYFQQIDASCARSINTRWIDWYCQNGEFFLHLADLFE